MKILTALLLLAPTATAADPPPLLADITQAAGITWTHSIGDDKLDNIVESTGAGVLLFDADGDGDLDLYLVNGRYEKGLSHVRGRALAGRLANALYLNDGNGRFSDGTARAGVGDTGYGMGGVAADYDNDGDTDLYVTNYGTNRLYRNRGDGTFEDVTEAAGVGVADWSAGATFFDYDLDGHLDLYVGNYLLFDPDYRLFYAAEAFPGPLSYRGRPDVLLRNRGDGTFEDVSRRAGIALADGRAMGVSSADFDADGRPDIFVANDGMENYAWRNRGDGTFENVALETGTAFGQNGEATSAMGPEFGDIDGDGHLDLLVPDMGYGCLYVNTGRGAFDDRSSQAGLARACGQYTSWSGNLADFDLDGRLDIFLANGDAHHLEAEGDLLLRNLGSRRFADITEATGADLKMKFVSRGSAVGDLDGDGDLDLVVLNLNARPRVLRTTAPAGRHWLTVRTVGRESNRDGIGAQIRLTAGGSQQMRTIRAASGYLSQSDPRAHFGLGGSARIDRLEIRWPSGRTQVLEGLAADQHLVVTEPEGP